MVEVEEFILMSLAPYLLFIVLKVVLVVEEMVEIVMVPITFRQLVQLLILAVAVAVPVVRVVMV